MSHILIGETPPRTEEEARHSNGIPKNKNPVNNLNLNVNKNPSPDKSINENVERDGGPIQIESIDRIGKVYDVDPNNKNKESDINLNINIQTQNQNPSPKSINSVQLQTSDNKSSSTASPVLIAGGPQIKNKVCIFYIYLLITRNSIYFVLRFP